MSRHRRRRAYRRRHGARARLAMVAALEFELGEMRRSLALEQALEQRRQALLERLGTFPAESPHQLELQALRARLEALGAPLGSVRALRVLEAPLERAAEALRRRLC